MNRIPNPVIAALSYVIPESLTHAGIDALFLDADAPGDPPDGNKQLKVQTWLRRTNKQAEDPLAVLGTIVEALVEVDTGNEYVAKRVGRVKEALEKAGLRYIPGGRFARGASLPALSLPEMIRKRDLTAVDNEFHRSLENLERSPREAVSAACNILESVCKCLIEDKDLTMPSKKDLQSVWKVVRTELGFDPGVLEDQDLQKILSGIISTVDGIGSLRTHASSAHGAGRKRYRLEPRHARLAASAAHTVAMFILESWDKRESNAR